jgi:hypothetical protein
MKTLAKSDGYDLEKTVCLMRLYLKGQSYFPKGADNMGEESLYFRSKMRVFRLISGLFVICAECKPRSFRP